MKAFVIFLFSLVGLIVGDALGPINNLLIHWDWNIPPHIAKFVYWYDAFIQAFILAIFLIFPIYLFRLSLWVLIIAGYLFTLLAYFLDYASVGIGIGDAFLVFVYRLFPISVGVFAGFGIGYFFKSFYVVYFKSA